MAPRTRNRGKEANQNGLKSAPNVSIRRSQRKRGLAQDSRAERSKKKQPSEGSKQPTTPRRGNTSLRVLESSTRKAKREEDEEASSLLNSLQRSERNRKRTPKGNEYFSSIRRDGKGKSIEEDVNLDTTRKKLEFEQIMKKESPVALNEQSIEKGVKEAAKSLLFFKKSPSKEATDNEIINVETDSDDSDDDDDDDRTYNVVSASNSYEEILVSSSEDEDDSIDEPSYTISKEILSANISRYSIGEQLYNGSFCFKFNAKHRQLSIGLRPDAMATKKQLAAKLLVGAVDLIPEIKSSKRGKYPHKHPHDLIRSIVSFKIHVSNVVGHDLTPKLKLPLTGYVVLVVEFLEYKVVRASVKSNSKIAKEFEDVDDFKMHAAAIFDHAEKELEERRKIPKYWKEAAKFKGMKDNDVIFQYPFDTGGDNFDKYEPACSSLNELKEVRTTNAEYRKRFQVNVTLGSFKRLRPKVWLNDEIINFWMLWISRDQAKDALFCSSFLYTHLVESGPEQVESWYDPFHPKRPKKDIFKYRMIFIPINMKDMHWSLCILLNIGAFTGEEIYENLRPSFVFFDSYGGSYMREARALILQWVSCEYTRIYGNDKSKPPLADTSLHTLVPKVPQQRNGYDCGVYILKYAHSAYQMKNSLINNSTKSSRDRERVVQLIERSVNFTFSQEDINRIRKELVTLIQNIAAINQSWSKNGKKVNNRANRVRKSNTSSMQSVNGASDSLALKENASSTKVREGIGIKSPLEDIDYNSTATMKDNKPQYAKMPKQQAIIRSNAYSNAHRQSQTSNQQLTLSNVGANHGRGNNVQNTHTQNAKPLPCAPRTTNYFREHLDAKVLGKLHFDLDNVIEESVWKRMTLETRVSYVLNRLKSVKRTNYTEQHLSVQVISKITSDLDNQIPNEAWFLMDELSKLSYVITRMKMMNQSIGSQTPNQQLRLQRQWSPGKLPLPDSNMKMGFGTNGQQQQEYFHAPEKMGLRQHIGIACGGETPMSKTYHTMAGPTPHRTALMKTVGEITKARTQKSARWIGNLKASTQNPDDKKSIVCRDDVKTQPLNGSKRKGSMPNKVTGVFNTANKKKLLRDSMNFIKRHNNDLHCEPLWPQANGVYILYNEIKRNSSGAESAKIEKKTRDRPQLNLLGSSEEAISNFKNIFSSEFVDASKYDIFYTTDPNEWVDRLGEEDGHQQTRGNDAKPSTTFQGIQEELEDNTLFSPR